MSISLKVEITLWIVGVVVLFIGIVEIVTKSWAYQK